MIARAFGEPQHLGALSIDEFASDLETSRNEAHAMRLCVFVKFDEH